MKTKIFALSLSLIALAACESPSSQIPAALPPGWVAVPQEQATPPAGNSMTESSLSAPRTIYPSATPVPVRAPMPEASVFPVLPSSIPQVPEPTPETPEPSFAPEPTPEPTAEPSKTPQQSEIITTQEVHNKPQETTQKPELDISEPEDPETTAQIQSLLAKEQQFREQLGEPERALQMIEQILALDPNHAEAHLRRGRNQHNSGQLEQAVQSLSKAVELAPGNIPYQAELYFRQAELAYQQKHFEQALALLKQADALHFKRNGVYGAYTMLYSAMGRHQEALENGIKTIELGTITAPLYNAMGIALDNLGDFRQAVQHFDRAIQLTPTDKVILRNKGVTHTRLQEYEQALEALNQALSLDPAYTDAHYEKAMAYYFIKSHQQALEAMNQAIVLDSTQARFYKERAAIYKALGEHELAEADHQYAISLVWHS